MSIAARTLIIRLIALALVVGYSAPVTAQRAALSPLVIRSAAGSHEFMVEVARTSEQQTLGLMFRRRLDPDSGMLFPLDPPRVMTMWMKNTFIPLDMLFIGPGGRIVRIAARAVPKSEIVISSGVPVIGVLELNGGSASRLGIREGDRVFSAELTTSTAP